jgi:hypothetical protein
VSVRLKIAAQLNYCCFLSRWADLLKTQSVPSDANSIATNITIGRVAIGPMKYSRSRPKILGPLGEIEANRIDFIEEVRKEMTCAPTGIHTHTITGPALLPDDGEDISANKPCGEKPEEVTS